MGQPDSLQQPVKGLVTSAVFFIAWLGWAARMFFYLRVRREVDLSNGE